MTRRVREAPRREGLEGEAEDGGGWANVGRGRRDVMKTKKKKYYHMHTLVTTMTSLPVKQVYLAL